MVTTQKIAELSNFCSNSVKFETCPRNAHGPFLHSALQWKGHTVTTC